MSAVPNDALFSACSVPPAIDAGNAGHAPVVATSKVRIPTLHPMCRVHATVTAQGAGMPAVRYSGVFDHSVDAARDAHERFPSATRIVVRCTAPEQEQQP
ncbi:hypothetical protein P3G55_21925 [Leptospira sp. 96542]|nr:hypothetical protein [Leptospira sp. 96542]